MAGAGQLKRRLYDRCIALAHRVGGALLDGKSVSVAERLRYRLADALIYGPLRNTLGFGRVQAAYVVGDAIGPDVFRFYRAIGLNLKQSYSLTEASGFVCLQPDAKVRAETVGVAVPDVELRIDSEGEVLVRGAGTFIGYYKDTDATAAAMTTDGWLRTGDTGVLDAEGNCGRRSRHRYRAARQHLFTPGVVENKLSISVHQGSRIGDRRNALPACSISMPRSAPGPNGPA
jgi:long-chain acyl-CoA synthetase